MVGLSLREAERNCIFRSGGDGTLHSRPFKMIELSSYIVSSTTGDSIILSLADKFCSSSAVA